MQTRDRRNPGAGAWLVLVGLLLVTNLAAAASNVDRQRLLEELRQGGLVIYFRHAQTDWSQLDRMDDLDAVDSCDPAQMRQLSDQGRETARAVGATLRRLKIPVDRVLASPYCRTVETARLFDLGPVEATRDLINRRVAAQVGGSARLAETAGGRLATPPRPGHNTVMVAHGNVFLLVAGTRPPEAGAAIVRPDGQGGFDVVAMLAPEQWAALERATD